eukprot:gene23265-14129_t
MAMLDHGSTRVNQTATPSTAPACNSGCIAMHTKLNEGKPKCCGGTGSSSMKCPRPAHYHCGPAPTLYNCSGG